LPSCKLFSKFDDESGEVINHSTPASEQER
jgi:hypothetical protein